MTANDSLVETAQTGGGGPGYSWEAFSDAFDTGSSLVASSGIGSWNPGITRVSGGTEIAATGTGGSLRFFWATNGSPTWHPEQVEVPGTTSTSPQMITSGSTIEIIADGP